MCVRAYVCAALVSYASHLSECRVMEWVPMDIVQDQGFIQDFLAGGDPSSPFPCVKS